MRSNHYGSLVVGAITLLALAISPVAAKSFGDWTEAQSLESLPGSSSEVNTASNDGCPIQSPNGLSLYMATNRPGGLGGIDIWVAHRSSTSVGFGAPVNLGPTINSAVDDFCPTPVLGGGLFFVSRRDGGCAAGSADIYFAWRNPFKGSWTPPHHLGCTVNSVGDEFSPSYVFERGRGVLYFSSNRGGNHDIFRSLQNWNGSFGTPVAVDALNTASNEFRPNVRMDGREIVFDSDRPGGWGATDIYAATRSSVNGAWSAPANLGSAINTPAGESRAALSWDGKTLLFGSGKPGGEGMSDIYFSTRSR